MMYSVCSVYDTKAGIWYPPMFHAHVAQAIRAVEQVANDASTSLGRFPADFELWRLGHFDDQTGEFSPARALLSSVLSLVRPAAAGGLGV